jgi:hypothetical protein
MYLPGCGSLFNTKTFAAGSEGPARFAASRKEKQMAGTRIRRLLAAGTVATVAMIAVAGAAFARPDRGTASDNVRPQERTEGEKYANDYGFGNSDEDLWSAGRTRQEISTHLAFARLNHSHELAVSSQRTEGEKYANNYGFGNLDGAVVDRGREADAARLQAYADAHVRRRMAPAEEFVSDLYGFRMAQEGIGADRSKAASVPTEPSSVDGLQGGQIVTLTVSLVLLAGIGVVIVRNQRSRTAI